MSVTTDSRTDLVALAYGMLAIAIAAGGIPREYRSLTVAEIDRIARAGMARLGLNEIWRLDIVDRRLNEKILREPPGADLSDYRAEKRDIWGGGVNVERAAVYLAWEHYSAQRTAASSSGDPLDTWTYPFSLLQGEAYRC